MTGKLINVLGNVCEPQYGSTNEVAIIPHVCNDKGVMGAGVALALKKAFSGVEYYYLKSKHFLGRNSWVNPNTETNDVIVVNMVAQHNTVSADNPIPLKYKALIECMVGVREDVIRTLHMKPEYEGKEPVIHCPKFGSDLAGGNWDFILELIREIWLEHCIDVVVYEFEADKEKWGVIK